MSSDINKKKKFNEDCLKSNLFYYLKVLEFPYPRTAYLMETIITGD